MNILVVGASGVLGRLICQELLRIHGDNIQLFVGDYKRVRGEQTAFSFGADYRFVDIDNGDSIEKALTNIDSVVVVLNQREPIIQQYCIAKKINCIDVTIYHEFIEKVEKLSKENSDSQAKLVMMAGFFPGLSGLLVKKGVSSFEKVDEINLTLLQSLNAEAGSSGIRDMFKLISTPVYYVRKTKQKRVSGFSKKKGITLPGSEEKYKVGIIAHSERDKIREKLGITNINYWTGWDNNRFNLVFSVLKRVGLIKLILKLFGREEFSKFHVHREDEPEIAFLKLEVEGVVKNEKKKKKKNNFVVTTFSDYGLTAMVTAALSKIIIEKDIQGVVYPFEFTTIDEVLNIINDERILFMEY